MMFDPSLNDDFERETIPGEAPFIAGIDEILNVGSSSNNDNVQGKNYNENQTYVKKFRLSMNREVPREREPEGYIPYRDIYRYSNLSEELTESIWRYTYQSQENVCCTWNDVQGKKLLTLTVEKIPDLDSEGQYLLSFKMNLFLFYPYLTCISQLLKPNYSRELPQLQTVYDQDNEAHNQILKSFYNQQCLNVVASLDEKHLIIRGLGKIRYFRLPTQLQDFFSPSYDINDQEQVNDDPESNSINDFGLKVRTFDDKTFYLFHNKYMRMQYLCDETNHILIELLQQEKLRNCNRVYHIGDNFLVFSYYESILMLVENYKYSLNIDILNGLQVKRMSCDMKHEIKSINALVQNEGLPPALIMYEIDKTGTLKFYASFEINQQDGYNLELIKQYKNEFYLSAIASRYNKSPKMIRFEINRIEGRIVQQFISDIPGTTIGFEKGSLAYNQIPNSSFVINYYNNFYRLVSLPILQFKERYQEKQKYLYSQGVSYRSSWKSCFNEEAFRRVIVEILNHDKYEIIEVINELNLVIVQSLEENSSLHLLSLHDKFMLKIEDFDKYIGLRYLNDPQGVSYFIFSVLTKTRKLMTLSVPEVNFLNLKLLTTDLPKFPANGEVILSDTGRNFMYLSPTYATQFSLNEDMTSWNSEKTTRVLQNNTAQIMKESGIYKQYLNFELRKNRSQQIIDEEKKEQALQNQLKNEQLIEEKTSKMSFSFSQKSKSQLKLTEEETQSSPKPSVLTTTKSKLGEIFYSQTALYYDKEVIIPYLDWIVLKMRQWIYFVDADSLKIQFMIKLREDILDIVVDDVIREDIYAICKSGVYKLNILRDIPGYLPRNLLIVENALSFFNFQRPSEIKYFESPSKIEDYQCIGDIYISRNVIAMKDGLSTNERQNIIDLSHYIESSTLLESLSYNITFRTHILKTIKDYEDSEQILNVLEKKFQNSPPEEIPYLTPDLSLKQLSQDSKLTPFDIILDLQHTALANAFLASIVQKDQKGLLYSETCDRNVIKMAHLFIDLKPYLESQLAFHAISDDYYKSRVSNNPDTQLMAAQQDSLFAIQMNIEAIEQEINISRKESILKRSLRSLRGKSAENETEIEEEFKIEHKIVMLKETMKKSEGSLGFLEILQNISQNDPALLEIESIKAIIEFKWTNYVQKFYYPHFSLMVCFILLFMYDQSLINSLGLTSPQHLAFYLLRITSLLILTAFMIYNWYLRKFGEKEIPYQDICLFATYFLYAFTSFTMEGQLYLNKCLQLLVVIFSFIKFCLLIRIFPDLSFLITMLISVSVGLKDFLIFFALVIVALGLILNIIMQGKFHAYSGVGEIDVYILALRQAIGDTDTEAITSGENFKLIAWMTWFIIAIVGNIVFMNFIIAVVSQSYDNCIAKKVSEIERAKLTLIIECERMLNAATWENPLMQPNYIIQRRQQSDGSQGLDDATQQWQGLFKELKNQNLSSTKQIKKDFSQNIQKLNQDVVKKLQFMGEDIRGMRGQITEEMDRRMQVMGREMITSLRTEVSQEVVTQMKKELAVNDGRKEKEEQQQTVIDRIDGEIRQLKERFDSLESAQQANQKSLETALEANQKLLLQIIEAQQQSNN